MRNKSFRLIVYLSSFIFLLSCSSNTSSTAILSQIDSSIVQVNKTLVNSNNNILESMKLKTSDVRTQYKAERWLPIAMHADSVARNLLRYIDDLKMAVNDSLPAEGVKSFFEENRGHALFQKVLHFKTRVVAIDSASDHRDWPMFFSSIEDSVTNAKLFLQQLQSSSPAEVQTFLSSLQSHVLRSEQQYLLYRHSAITIMGDHFETFEAIVGQNAQVLQVGNELKITAGLGSFSKQKMPNISIGGKPISLNENGFVVYKMKTPKQLGNYSVPVKVQFIDQEGKSQEREFSVEYQVVDTVKKQ